MLMSSEIEIVFYLFFFIVVNMCLINVNTVIISELIDLPDDVG